MLHGREFKRPANQSYSGTKEDVRIANACEVGSKAEEKTEEEPAHVDGYGVDLCG